MFWKTSEPHGLRYNPFKALVVPRPIGWISTVDQQGRVNLAPYSFYNGVSGDPPMVMFAGNGTHVSGGFKDSIANVMTTGEFVVNLVSHDLRNAMNLSSGSYERGVDEMAMAGLAPAPSVLVKPPRVAASPAQLECVLVTSVDLPRGRDGTPNRAVFGLVLGVHIDDAFIKNGIVDTLAMRPLARLGYQDYTSVDNRFTLARPGETEPPR